MGFDFEVGFVLYRRLTAYPKGDKNDGHLALFLEFADPESLPPGWTRDVKFSLTLVNQGLGKSNIVMGTQRCFHADIDGWGLNKFVPLNKLHATAEGFLVNNSLIVLAVLHVLPAVVVPEETVKLLSCKDGDQADGASVGKSQTDSSCQAAQATDNTSLDDDDDDDGASEEGSDDGDGTSDDGSFEEDVDNDDVSSPCLDDGGEDISLLNQSNALEEASHTVGSHGLKSNSVTAETEVSNDDAPKDDVGDEVSSLVSNDSANNGTSLDQVRSLENASQTVENGDKGFNTLT